MSRAGTPRRSRAAAVATPVDVGRLMTLTEVADRLAVSVRTLDRMIARGELRIVRLGRGRGVRRVAESEVVRLIAAGTPGLQTS